MAGDDEVVAKPRHEWMDVSRGAAIVLVLVLHSVSYFKAQGGAVPDYANQFVNFFAPVRMPTLYFLSGMLLDASLRKGFPAYAIGKLRNLLWPFLLWLMVWSAASGTFADLATLKGWGGGWYLWFMYFLIVYFAVAAATVRVNHLVVAAYAFVASLLMKDGDKYTERLFFFMAIFFIGAFAGGRLRACEAALKGRAPLLLAPLAIGIMGYSAVRGPVRYSPHDAVIIMICVAAACALAVRVPHGRLKALLAFIGMNSIVFYVVHMPLIALVVRWAKASGISSFHVVAGASLLCASLVPLGLVELRRRVPAVGWLFSFPELGRLQSPKGARASTP